MTEQKRWFASILGFVIPVVLILLSGETSPAQDAEVQTRVAGRVTTLEGEAISGARVTIRSWGEEGGGHHAEMVTDADGRYELQAVPMNCRVFVTANGRASMYRTHPVARGINRGWDFALPLSARVSGRVLDLTGKPQARRMIELWPIDAEPPPAPGLEFWATGGSDDVSTGDDGAFNLANAAPGNYRVIVYRPSPLGGDRNLEQVPIEGGRLKISSGGAIEDFTIRVNPPEKFAISGHVVDADSKPVAGMVVDSFIPHGRHWWTKTGEDGAFYLDGLDGIGVSKLRVYFNDVHGAGSFTLSMRDVPVNTHDLKMVLPGTAKFEGLVVDAKSGAPVNTFEVGVPLVRLATTGAVWEKPTIRVERGASGRFTLYDVPAGLVQVEVRAGGLGAQRFEVEAVAGVNPPVECRMLGPAIVSGRTTLDGAVRKTTIVVRDEWLSSDDNGEFRFDAYPNGPLTLWFFVNDGWHRTATVNLVSGQGVRQDMELGGPGRIHGAVRLPEGNERVTIRLAASPAPDGWLDIGRPTPEEEVLAYTFVDANSTEYKLDHLPKGKWHLMVGRYEPSMHRAVLMASRVVEITQSEDVIVDFDFRN